MEPYLLKKEKYFWKVKFVTYNTKIPLSSVNSSKLLTQFSVSNVWSLLFLLLVSPPSLLVSLTFQSQEKKKKSTNTTVTTRSVTHPPPTRSISLPLCYLRFSLVSTEAKTLSSTTGSVSCAHQRHHHHLYSRHPPLSLSLSLPLVLLFLPLFLVVSGLTGFNLEREKLDNLAWVWNLGIRVVLWKKKKKNQTIKQRNVGEGKEGEIT